MVGILSRQHGMGIVRHPIYSSMTFFVLPAVALLMGTWVYVIVSVCLYVGVTIFVRKEERQLRRASGPAYADMLMIATRGLRETAKRDSSQGQPDATRLARARAFARKTLERVRAEESSA